MLVLAATSCGGSEGLDGTAPDVSYHFERPYTGQTANALLFDFPAGSKYQVRVKGTGLVSASGRALDEYQTLTPRLDFTYSAEGAYKAVLDLLRGDGTPYLSDSVSFAYSTKAPAAPVVSFSEAATNDAAVTMQLAGELDPDTKEIAVEGDVVSPPGGKWQTLSAGGVHLLTVTPGDGLKAMTVSLRNIYGNESAAVGASILRKSDAPTDCAVEMPGSGSATSTIDLKLYATNDGPLFYAVFGDVDPVQDFQPFTSGDLVHVALSGGEGQKKLKIRIRDLASNYCPEMQQTITVSEGYVEKTVEIAGAPFYVDSDLASLNLRYDHFAEVDPIEMKITGDVVPGATIGYWLPFSPTMTVQLAAGSGQKTVFAQFRDKTLTESFLVSASTFLQPTVDSTDAGAPKRDIHVSKIRGLATVTIVGCGESYNAVPWAAAYRCTPAGAAATVTFTFRDGTTLGKTVVL